MRVIVVGSGILGASTAYHLARRGAEVVVVDQAHSGQATAAGAGIIDAWSRGEVDDFFRILSLGASYYPTLLDMLAEDGETETGYRKVGSLSVASSPVDLLALEQRVRACAAAAPLAGAVTRLTDTEARALFPPLRPGLSAIHVSGAARVDGRLLAASLRRAATKRGVAHLSGRGELMLRGGRVVGVRLTDRVLEADAVVVAAGAWAPEILAPIGVHLPVEPQRGQILHLTLPETDTSAWPIVRPLGTHYLLAFEPSRIVVGATREPGSGFDHRVTATGQAELLNTALDVAPGLSDATVVETRIGFRPIGPDARPWIAAVRGLPGLLVGNGLGPSGLTIGPVAGKLLAERTLAPEAPTDPAIRASFHAWIEPTAPGGIIPPAS